MSTTSDLAAIVDLLEQAGSRRYGSERVNQLEHALQCAGLAESEGADDALTTACLLHDLGHLMHDLGEDAAVRGIDDRHQFRALHMLRRHFGETVLEPVRLHVDAKRYLCAVQPGYWDALSPGSKRSLELQGGVLPPEAARRFIEQPYGRDAARLRAWDDRAKVPGKATPGLDYFARIMERCALP
jgi:phosphonate degradation associated HDIG domain protein